MVRKLSEDRNGVNPIKRSGEMIRNRIDIEGIPAIVWGNPSDKVWLCVHGKMSSKEAFATLAEIAERKGYQTLSFDLPQHGERKEESPQCDIWSGKRELPLIADYAFRRWKEVSLYGCSLGAYFSLNAYPGCGFQKCLFQSPILDMEYLVRQMMLWFGITEERLEREKEIDTPIDLMTWDYYRYVLDHPVRAWDIPTHILFGGKDDLQTMDIVKSFAQRFGCGVTVSPDSAHPFMEAADIPILRQWLEDNL